MNDYHNIYMLLGVAFIALSVVGLLLWKMVESQLRFRAICENSGSMIVVGKAITEKNGKISDIELVGCNEVYARHLHKNIDKIIGRRITRDFFDGVEPEWLDVVRDAITTHESRHLEFSYEPKGTRYTGSVFCLSPVRKHCCFTMEETSADFKSKSELVRVRKLMDMILDMSGIGMWQWDLKNNTLNVIKAAFKIVTDYDRQNISMDDVLQRIHPDDRKILLSLRTNFPVNNKPSPPVEFRMKDKQGEWCWFQAVAVKVECDGEGAPEALVGIVSDIDSLKRSRLKVEEVSNELKLNQQRLFNTFRECRTGFVHWDVETDKIYFDENFWEAIGGQPLAPGVSVPETMEEMRKKVIFADPESMAEWVSCLREGRKPVDDFYYRCQITFVPGVWLEVRNSIGELDCTGHPLTVNGFVIDITKLKKNEDALRAALKAADEANRSKGRFFAIMSHEIRTPLNAIIGFSSILKEAGISTQLQSYAESIKNSGEMLLDLINDLLDLAKIESAKMGLKLEPVNLFNLLFELKRMFALKVKSRNLYFDLNCAQDLPMFNLDVKRTQQVLVNLLGNAVKFTEQGGITVDVAAERNIRGGVPSEGSGIYRLMISVRDTGQGIPEENFDIIFNPFEQAANNHDNYVEGTGLGLAICKNLVELMEGTLTFESAVGKGSNFIVEFDEVEAVIEKSDSGSIEDALEASAPEPKELSDRTEIPPEILSELPDCFGERFIEMKNGMHVQSAHVLVEDLTKWMKDNNSYVIEEIVDSLRQAVDDFDVTEVKRIARFFIEQRDENE